ncbi:MAG: hypothetical protein Q8N23_25190 [Archangium sp.]|nr:hypothetical protein [Archangium sp.]MDP3576111.1 hypothetical protein [Archangium sp.]
MRTPLLGLFFVGCTAAPLLPTAPASPPKGLEVEAVHGLGLFSDERARAQVILAEALSQRDAGVFPLETVQRAWALAAEGRNPFSGASCGKGLSSWGARKRWGQALGVTGSVSAQVWCAADAGCELSVYGRPLDDDADDRFTLVAPLAENGAPLSAFATALDQLSPPPPRDSGGLIGGLGMGNSGGAPIQEEDRLKVRLWPADQRSRTAVPDAQSSFPGFTVTQLQSCLSASETSIDVLMEVTPSGTLGRCEGTESEDVTQASCACGQLQRLAPAAWMAGRRWNVGFDLVRRDQTTADRRFVLSGYWTTYLERYQVEGQKYPRFKPKVQDPSIQDWSPGSPRLATGCFGNAFTAAGSLNSRWALWFDAVGRPTKVLEQKGYPPLPKELAECVARALRTALSPCPSRAGLWAMADLHVTARDPNAPPASLKDVVKPAP